MRSVDAGRVDAMAGPTISALVRRGLCDPDRVLSPLGRVTAISLLSLPEQCRVLNIPLSLCKSAWLGRPEKAALSLLSEKPRWVFIDEGKMLHALIHALVLPRLYSLAADAWNATAGYDCARSWLYRHYASYHDLLELDPQLTQGMLNDIHRWDRDAFLGSWRKLGVWNRPYHSHPAADVKPKDALAVLDSIGEPRLSAIAARIFSEPFAYYHGWPDLMFLDSEGRLRFVEVKTTDRLHFGQIVTICDMRDSASLDISVMRLCRPPRPFLSESRF
jgi:hypothetical protein